MKMTIDNDPLAVLVRALPNKKMMIDQNDDMYYVQYYGGDVLEGCARIGEFGKGPTIREAALDYINRIAGKTLVFGEGPDREKVIVAVLQIERYHMY